MWIVPKNSGMYCLYAPATGASKEVLSECLEKSPSSLMWRFEAFAIANLVNKMETEQMVPAPVWTDLKTFRPKFFRGFVDILTGGYPCQPFSAAGKRKGSEDPRHLWPYIKIIIGDCEPRWVFFENVEGHISLGIEEVLADLEEMGYQSAAGIFSATEVGAPHQRKRVFILGYSEGIGDKELRCSYKGTNPTGEKRPILFNQSGGDELADSKSRKSGEQKAGYGRESTGRGSEAWPARPGEEQYGWEEPRVVADTLQSESREVWRAADGGGCCGAQDTKQTRNDIKQTQPKLGGTPDGTADRVDRLRLLGNGVVPQTAEKAFRVLYNKLKEQECLTL